MDIKNEYYRYIVKDNVYTIENIHATLILRFRLVNVTKNMVITPTKFMQPDDIETLEITDEGVYVAELFTGNGEENINIYYYPITKELVIDNMKDILCDCDSLDSVCGNGESPIIKNNKELQFLFTSVNSYIDTLLSPDYVKNYMCCFGELIKGDYRMMSYLSNSYDALNSIGKLPDNINIVRLYTLYKYILLYIIELDYARFVIKGNSIIQPPNPIPDDPGRDTRALINTDRERIDKLFELGYIESCTKDLNVDMKTLINSFDECYQTYSYNVCMSGINPCPGNSMISGLKINGVFRTQGVGVPINVSIFQWDIDSGVPENLVINDSEGQIVNEEVSGTSHTLDTSKTYVLNSVGDITWSLKGDNTNQAELNVKWVEVIYKGKLTDERWPTETEVLAGDKIIRDLTDNQFIWQPDTLITEIAWVAIPVSSAIMFTEWLDLATQTSGPIYDDDSLNFMLRHANIQVIDGVDCYLYRFGMFTHFNNTLRLY